MRRSRGNPANGPPPGYHYVDPDSNAPLLSPSPLPGPYYIATHNGPAPIAPGFHPSLIPHGPAALLPPGMAIAPPPRPMFFVQHLPPAHFGGHHPPPHYHQRHHQQQPPPNVQQQPPPPPAPPPADLPEDPFNLSATTTTTTPSSPLGLTLNDRTVSSTSSSAQAGLRIGIPTHPYALPAWQLSSPTLQPQHGPGHVSTTTTTAQQQLQFHQYETNQLFTELSGRIAGLFPKLPTLGAEMLVRQLMKKEYAQGIHDAVAELSTMYQLDNNELVTRCKSRLNGLTSSFLRGGPVHSCKAINTAISKREVTTIPALDSTTITNILCTLISNPNTMQSNITTDTKSTTGITLHYQRPTTGPAEALCTAPPPVLREFLTSTKAKKLVLQAISSLSITSKLLSSSAFIITPTETVAEAGCLNNDSNKFGLNGLSLSSDIDFGNHRAVQLDMSEFDAFAQGVKYGASSLLDVLQPSGTISGTSGTTTGTEIQGGTTSSTTGIEFNPKLHSALQFKHMIFTNDSQPLPIPLHDTTTTNNNNKKPTGDTFWLLGGVATPQLSQTFASIDTANLFWADGHNMVYLRPGQQHPITVAFSCADGPGRAAEKGVLQQILVFLLAVEKGTVAYAQFNEVEGVAVVDVGDEEQFKVFAVARRLSASVLQDKGADLIDSVLDADAKPYISKAIQNLLDSEPEALKTAEKDEKLGWQLLKLPQLTLTTDKDTMFYIPDSVLTILPDVRAQHNTYVRLLALEEYAMDQDIHRHDMFYVRLRYAVFQGYTPPVVKYTIMGNGSNASAVAPELYRGPDITQLQKGGIHVDSSGMHTWVLGYLDVPGLPEGRPALLVGDTAYIRFVDNPGHRFDAIVASVSGSTVFLLLPSKFFSKYLIKALCGDYSPSNDNDTETKKTKKKRMEVLLDGLVHVRFSYDKRPLQQMRAAVYTAALKTAQSVADNTTTTSTVSSPTAAASMNGASSTATTSASTTVGHASKSKSIGSAALPCLLPAGILHPPKEKKRQSKQSQRVVTFIGMHPSASSVAGILNNMVQRGKQQLNLEQEHAVAAVLGGAGRASPYALFGPAGTGKTVTLVEMALQILHRYPTSKLLLAAPLPFSADVLCASLATAGITTEEMIRLNDPRRPPYTLSIPKVMQYCLVDDETRMFALPPLAHLRQCRVIVTTCSGAGLLYTADPLNKAVPKPVMTFTHVLIDEAGQALMPEALIALNLMAPPVGVVVVSADTKKEPKQPTPPQPNKKKNKDSSDTTSTTTSNTNEADHHHHQQQQQGDAEQLLLGSPAWGAVLCGDPRQLGPVVRSKPAAAGGLVTSLLESFINTHTSIATVLVEVGRVAPTSMLVRNYRSHKELLQLPSKMFYDNNLVAAADPENVQPPEWDELYDEERARVVEERNALLSKNDGDDDSSTELAVEEEENNSTPNDTETKANEDTATEAAPKPTKDMSSLHVSLLCYGVRGQQQREADVASYFNPIEASTVVELIEGLLNSGSGVTVNDIGVMAMYRKQVQKIRLMLRQRKLGSIRVGTLDDYQGQEERIIFISTVLSKPEHLSQVLSSRPDNNNTTTTTTTNNNNATYQPIADAAAQTSIWGNPKRFNVAVTRAKALLVVVCHPSVLALDPCWKELLRYAVSRGLYRGAGAATMRQRYGINTFRGNTGIGTAGTTDIYNDGGGDDSEFADSWPQVSNGGNNADGDDDDDDDEMNAAIEELSELAVLGVGSLASMYPDVDGGMDGYGMEYGGEYDDVYADEMEFRVRI